MRKTIFLALVSAWCAAPGLASAPAWSRAAAVPTRAGPLNVLRLEGDRLLWNGQAVSEATVRQFLGVVATHMSPQPLTVLSYGATTSPEQVRQARSLVDKAVACTPRTCLEVTSPAG